MSDQSDIAINAVKFNSRSITDKTAKLNDSLMQKMNEGQPWWEV